MGRNVSVPSQDQTLVFCSRYAADPYGSDRNIIGGLSYILRDGVDPFLVTLS